MNRFAQLLTQLHSHASLQCIENNHRSHTYAELLAESERWQTCFEELKIAAGSVVALRADYSLASIGVMLALFARRAIVALIPRDADAAQYLIDSHASALLELNSEGGFQWHAIPNSTPHPLLDRLRTMNDGGVIIFTSGSTGRPKAALQSLERFLYKFRRPGRRFRTLGFLLFDHIAGLDTLFYTLTSGGTLILTRRRDPSSILDIIESHQVEVLPASPSFLRLLCAFKDSSKYRLLSLQVITYGSEPMDPSTLAQLNARFPHVQISQKYGTTETGSPRTQSRGNDSLWLKIKNDDVDTKVINDILWIRSEGTMLGYLNAPSPVDEEGWYCTGDLVEVDGEWIRFRGRKNDIINVGGEKVAPVEVEQTILQLDFVRNVVVTGEPHALMGQVVTAQVTLAGEAANLKEAIKRIRLHCKKHLAPHKIPVRIEVSSESLTSARQKLQRRRASD